MANTLYDNARALWANGDIDWTNDTFYCILVNATYTFNVAHTKLSAIDGANNGPRDYGVSGVAGISIAGKGVQSNGAIYGDPVRFITCAAGRPAVTGIIIYRYADGVDSNADLVYYADTATGLPITPNGGDIIVTWSTGTNRILRL